MTKANIKFYIILLATLLCTTKPAFVHAAGGTGMDTKAVVFLLDTSGSMQTNDPDRYALDGIAQLIYALPTNYEVGFVAYNGEVQVSQPLVGNHQREQVMKTAGKIEYTGYSNAGAGLKEAVGLLQDCGASEKHIVLLSDGELLLGDEEQTRLSEESYEKAVERARQEGVRIHVIGLGEEMEDRENGIFQAASYTGGGSFHTPQALEIQSAIDAILAGHLGIKQVTAAIVETDGSQEEILIELPFLHADKVRVLLTGSSAIENLQTHFKAGTASQRKGERYSLLELDEPQNEQVEIRFTAAAGNQVRITLIPEYEVTARAEVSYHDREPLEKGQAVYDREAEISFTFFSRKNQQVPLWTEDYFHQSKMILWEGDTKQESALEKGKITLKRAVTGAERIRTEFDSSLLPVNVLSLPPMEIELKESPPLPEPEQTGLLPEKPSYVLSGILLLTAMAVLVLLLHKRKPKPEPALEKGSMPAPGKASYVGNIRLYITNAPSGHDIEPLAYDLFRLPATKVISIAEILDSCGVGEEFPGAEGIYLSSGQGRSITLTNQSDCCIMKSGEILMKNKSYLLLEDAKVDITFEDESSEVMFQYKVSKIGRSMGMSVV